MATPEVPPANNVMCNDCWEVFLTSVDLEMHRGNCPRLMSDDKATEESEKNSISSGVLNKVDLDTTAESSLNSNEASDAELTVLKTMPPTTDESVDGQNGELLSVFDQPALVAQSGSSIGDALQDFNISLPAQSILGSYIQQQTQQQQEHDQNIKDEIKKQNDEHLKQQQQLLQQQQQQQQAAHDMLQQQTALLTTSTMLENGLKSHSLPLTKNEKNTYKRKLLPKSNQNAEFTQMFQCTQCDSIFYNDASYRDHARSHARVKEFICEYCGITLTKYEQMTKHLDKEHNSDLSYYCYLCYTPADDKFSLQEHLKYCGKNDGLKNHLTQSSANSQLLPNLLSGSTMKYSESTKGLIICPKCGQILGSEESLNVQDKPLDVQCKFCATIITLVRQSTNNLPQPVASLENKSSDLLDQSNNATLQEPMLMSSLENSHNSASTPLLLYSQANDSVLNQNCPITSVSVPTLSSETCVTASGMSSVSIPTVAVGSPNHMTLGINTSNGLMVLTLPVVTADKVAQDSVTAPVLQLPGGNIILLGTDVGTGSPLPSLNTNSPVSGALLPASLPITTNSSASPILPTNDILMTAAAGINSPSSPEIMSPLVSDQIKDYKSKMSRYTCHHCGKMFEAQQSWRRHVQTHVAPKKQHVCQLCNKIFSRPGQLKEHVNKMHGSQDETNNNEVHMIKIKS